MKDYDLALAHTVLESIGNRPGGARSFHVYSYQHIDDDMFMLKAREPLAGYKNGRQLIDEVEQLLKDHGWEGDGELQLMWFPPFLGVGVEDTYGLVAFHVKQLNNGTSWLASSVLLPYRTLNQHS